MISDAQLLRYSRQIMLPGFDVAGQERLLKSRVLILGLGGLGSPVALYLAAAGVGELVLADGDDVDASNLQRQIAHGEKDLGRNKAFSCRDSVLAINPAVNARVVGERLVGEALAAEVAGVDLVVDATDSFATRLDLNQACLAAGRAWVSGAAIRSEGQLTVFDPRRSTACYRCLYPEQGAAPNLSCSESGVLAPIVGIIGALQAQEAIKVLAGYGEPLYDQLLLVDGLTLDMRCVRLKKNPDCSHCNPDSPPAGA